MFGSTSIVSEGPRLDTLEMGSSSYGEKIRIAYGTNRLPANLVWAGRPTEHRSESTSSGGGKGGGGVSQTSINYTYSCSLVYLVCAGPVAGIRKIWGGGQLIYDASGDNLVGTQVDRISILLGTEAQLASPVMQAEVGALTPAHKGQVLIVFNDYDLSDKFSNRFPSLQVEVCQTATITGTRVDPVPVALADIIHDMCERSGIASGNVDTSGVTQSVHGWNVSDAYREALERIGDAFGIKCRDDAGTLVFYETDLLPNAATITVAEMGADGDNSDPGALLPVTQPDEYTLPAKMTVKYQDIARDGLSCSQTVMRTTVASTNEATETYDFLMDATTARRIADRRLYRQWIEGVTYGPIKLPPKYIGLRPGHVVQATDDVGAVHAIRLTTVSIGADFSVEVSGVAHEAANATSYVEGDSGSFTPVTIANPGTTTARLMNLAPLTTEHASKFGFYLAASGPSSAWRQAVLYQSPDAGINWTQLDSLPTYTVMGACTTTLAAPPSNIGAGSTDMVSTVRVSLLKGEILSVTDEQLRAGANTALIGAEVIQFGQADLVAPGEYELSHLVRGVNATEAAMAGHTGGEDFTMLDAPAFVELPIATIGASRQYKVVPIGGDITAEPPITFTCSGESIHPWPPTRITGSRNAGDLTITWLRRSRLGSALPNRADIPLDDVPEAYRVEILDAAGTAVVRTMTASTHAAVYTATQQTADFGAAQTSVNVRIAQVSPTYGPGRTNEAAI